MAGLDSNTPTPTEIRFHRRSRLLEITFSDDKVFSLSCEFLRVYSPSAEVRGHGPGQEVLQAGKKEVTINRISPVGSYAIQLDFSDRHNTGIYSWDLLYHFGLHQDTLWENYLQRMKAAGKSREATVASTASGNPQSGTACQTSDCC